MDSAEFDAIWNSLPGPETPSDIPYGAPTPGATELSTVSTPEAGPGILKEGANIAALAGQGLFGNFFDEALAVPSSVIRAGGNLLSGNAPDLGGSYNKEQQIWSNILKQAAQETPVAGTIAEIGGAVVSPLNKILPGGGLFKNILGAGAQGAIGGFGAGDTLEERIGGAASGAGIGAGTAGALGVAGKSFRGIQDILRGSKEGTELAEYGLSASAIRQSSTKTARKAGEAPPVIAAAKRLAKEGSIIPGEATINKARIEEELVDLGEKVGNLYAKADTARKGSVRIPFNNTIDWLSKQDDYTQEQGLKLLKEWTEPLVKKGDISIARAAENASSWSKQGASTIGVEGTESLTGNLKKFMGLDAKQAVEKEMQNPVYKKALGDKGYQEFMDLKRGMKDRFSVLPALEKASSRSYLDTAKDKFTGLIRTSGGIGSLLAGATVATGGVTAPLLLGAAAAPLFLTPGGRMALGNASEKAGSLAGLFGNAAIKDGAGLFLKNVDEGVSLGGSRLGGGAVGQVFSDAGSESSAPATPLAPPPQPAAMTSDEFDALWNSLDQKKNDVAPATGDGVEPVALLQQGLDEAGITDPKERAQFLGQMAHESSNFSKLEEVGSKKYLSKYEPGTRIGKRLGNTEKGDSERFKGRGFIQLTGRENYKKFGDLIGEDLIANPEKAADPEIAKKIAIAYWNERVKPKVTDFSDTTQVTKLINGGYNGLADRKKKVELFSTKVETA